MHEHKKKEKNKVLLLVAFAPHVFKIKTGDGESEPSAWQLGLKLNGISRYFLPFYNLCALRSVFVGKKPRSHRLCASAATARIAAADKPDHNSVPISKNSAGFIMNGSAGKCFVFPVMRIAPLAFAVS